MYEAGRRSPLNLEQFPYFQFQPNWEVSIIPQHPYAEIRFLVRERGSDKTGISVYLDATDALGAVGKPYWEIYPDQDGGASRFLLGQEDDLMNAINNALHRGKSV